MTLEERLEAIVYLKQNAKYSDFGKELLQIMQDLENQNKNLSQRLDKAIKTLNYIRVCDNATQSAAKAIETLKDIENV